MRVLSDVPVAEGNSVESAGVFAYPPRVRWVVVALDALALVMLAYLGLRLQSRVLERTLIPPARTLWRFIGPFSAGPWVLAWLVQRACAASLCRSGEGWTLRARRTRVEIPGTARARLRQWRLPFPGPGGELELASGALLSPSLEWRPPFATLALLREGRAETALTAYARERAQWRSRLRVWQWLVKWLVLPGVLAWPFFNLEQWIEFGGTLGEYHQSGLIPWLWSFARDWLMTATWLLLFAGFWRAVCEAIALAATLRAPAKAGEVRFWAETASRAAAFLVLPLLLVWRFILS